jgi:hypothetical protein
MSHRCFTERESSIKAIASRDKALERAKDLESQSINVHYAKKCTFKNVPVRLKELYFVDEVAGEKDIDPVKIFIRDKDETLYTIYPAIQNKADYMVVNNS